MQQVRELSVWGVIEAVLKYCDYSEKEIKSFGAASVEEVCFSEVVKRLNENSDVIWNCNFDVLFNWTATRRVTLNQQDLEYAHTKMRKAFLGNNYTFADVRKLPWVQGEQKDLL